MTKEIWKPLSKNMYYFSNIVNQDYEVSNLGRIRNKKTGKMIRQYYSQGGKKLKWTMHNSHNGYNCTLQFLVDQTVYITFNNCKTCGESYGKEIKHRDGNYSNNSLDNLYL